MTTTTAAGAGAGNITSASDTSTPSLPPEGHGNLRMLSKFEQRLSFAENPQIVAKGIPNTLEDDNTPLAVEYIDERGSREALASSPSTAVNTSFTPVKLRIKRPPDCIPRVQVTTLNSPCHLLKEIYCRHHLKIKEMGVKYVAV